MFKPNLEALPAPQRAIWDELKSTPKDFVLYGGTALALRLGHRQSEDFDFFSNRPFTPVTLRDSIPYLKHAEMTQFQDNTLTAILERGGPVKISFFGSLSLKRVQDPDVVLENAIQVASLLDLAATKLTTIQQRALAKDYLDMAAIIDAGIDLPQALAAARAVFGKEFNGALSLKALAYFGDGDLPSLSLATQNKLRAAAVAINLRELPLMVGKAGLSREGKER
jgi:Nucleotidyl transferase AbiEii toxin, Type IV TA system